MPPAFWTAGDLPLLTERMTDPGFAWKFSLLSRIYELDISLFTVTLLPTSKGSCLHYVKVQNALGSFFLALLPHLNMGDWNPGVPSVGFFNAPALFPAFRWLPVLHFLSSPVLPSGFGILSPNTQWRPLKRVGGWMPVCLRLRFLEILICHTWTLAAIKSSLNVPLVSPYPISGKFFLSQCSKRHENSHVSFLFYEAMSFFLEYDWFIFFVFSALQWFLNRS